MNGHRWLIALGAVAGFAAGCGGGSCPTETPEIQKIQSCTAQPGQTVSVHLQLCPTCNLSNISCEVDMSGASSGIIQLDPVAQRCESSTSCNTAPSCSPGAVCTFTAPSTSGPYTLQAFDPVRNAVVTAQLDVGTGPVACAF
jgi:hypothetical protein